MDIRPGETVLEVGPGLGVLTRFLVERADKVITVELDRRLAAYVQDRFGAKVEMLQGDALEVELPSFDRFISNVPYSISSPLIFRLLEHEFKSAIIMVQKEFADRMVAAPDSDDYSRLTVSVYYRAKCERLEQVPRNKFWPEPEVDSTVLRLTPRPPPFHVHDEQFFFRLVERLFGQRRKKIGTVLKKSDFLRPEQLDGIPHLDDRVEALSPEQIGQLADLVWQRKRGLPFSTTGKD